MDVSALSNLTDLSKYAVNGTSSTTGDNTTAFEDVFNAAVNQVNDTNNYSNAAEEAETSYALGLNDSTTDLLVAQQKANLSLQYTMAIRNNVMDAYKEIMNMQF